MVIPVRCRKCREYTDTCQDNFRIEKRNPNTYYIYCICKDCNKSKSKKLSNVESNNLPKAICEAAVTFVPLVFKSTDKILDEKSGGLLPLALLVPLIISGISALTGVGTAVANTVINNKKADAEIAAYKNLSGTGLRRKYTDEELIDIYDSLGQYHNNLFI